MHTRQRISHQPATAPHVYLSASLAMAGNSFTTKAGVAMLTCYDGARTIGCHTDPMGEPFFWGMGAGTLLWHGGGFFLLALALRELPALYAVTIYEVRNRILDVHTHPTCHKPCFRAHLAGYADHCGRHERRTRTHGACTSDDVIPGAVLLVDATHPWWPWYLRQASMAAAVQNRTRRTTTSRQSLQKPSSPVAPGLAAPLPHAALPGGRSSGTAAQRPIVLPHAYDVLGTRGELRARSVWQPRESRRRQVRRNRQHRNLEMLAIHGPLPGSGVDSSCHDLYMIFYFFL